MTNSKTIFALMISLALLNASCSKSSDPEKSNEVPTVYTKVYGATSITSDGTYITIKTHGTPDHKSVYYPTSNSLYQDFSGTTFSGVKFAKNPNTISSFNYTFKIPLNPKAASTHAATLHNVFKCLLYCYSFDRFIR